MFRADDKEYETLVAENRLITDVQVAIERAMKEKDFSQAKLARMLDISEARVSQILSGNGKNLQARTIARIAFVLGFQAVLEFSERRSACDQFDVEKWSKFIGVTRNRSWNDIANENEVEWAKAA